jgi:hypothetical protein
LNPGKICVHDFYFFEDFILRLVGKRKERWGGSRKGRLGGGEF